MAAVTTYHWLMAAPGQGDPFDRHLFASAIAIALTDAEHTLAAGLGLSAENLAALVGLHFPQAPGLLSGLDPDDDGRMAISLEEPDLRQLLLDHRSHGYIAEEWLAHIIARRSLQPNHLWQDLGLTGRADLSLLMMRHFAPLAAANVNDMKWKKFFYRTLCQQEGVSICKSPTCDSCRDFVHCFGAEEGSSLLAI